MKGLLTALLLPFLFFSLVACGSEGADIKKEDNEEVDTEEVSDDLVDEDEKNDDIYFDGETAEIRDVKIKITDTKVIEPGDEGNEYGEKPTFAIWYEATNKTDEDIDPMIAWFAIFTAIQDNDPNMVNELEVGNLPDDAHLDTQMNTIKKDGTVENSISYELDDMETPITLIATQGVGGDEIGRQNYEVK